ncbi:bifunctional MaoC family dehydratase N-terminal/OB-fold nucleic acid binding domain-containing protein [Enemella sp. A6]|uniref:bifunctional MaoC family dehydratase N-terminal/OB-fold nucleic acid binding domain-containing protein n=1 Tax=Enemella sp. A6 TaxID=3440152 RepID=UPI003EB8FA26
MSDNDYEARLQAFVGHQVTPRRKGQDAVNQAMIRHWVEAMGDENPIYTDAEAARATGRDQIVAPATMAQAWTMRGLKAHLAGGGAGGMGELIALLDEGGYTSVVATDSDFEFHRELVPGDEVDADEVVESISPEKATGLGVGRFITTVRTYRDQNDEVVAVQNWRTLRFKPGTGRMPAQDKPAVDEKPEEEKPEEGKARALRPRPAINLDNQFWFDAAKEHRLVIQRCADCGELRHPPGPACPHCQSFNWDTVEASGEATVYSYIVAHHPPHPAFDYPLPIAVLELAEGTRLISNLVGIDPADITIGMPVRLEWLDADPDLTLPVFRPVTEQEQ